MGRESAGTDGLVEFHGSRLTACMIWAIHRTLLAILWLWRIRALMLLTAEVTCTKGCLLRCSMLRRNWGHSGMLGSPPQRYGHVVPPSILVWKHDCYRHAHTMFSNLRRQQQRCPPEFGRCKRVRSLGQSPLSEAASGAQSMLIEMIRLSFLP